MKKNIILILGFILLVFLCFKLFSTKNSQELITEKQALIEENKRLTNQLADYQKENIGLILKVTKAYKKNKKLVLKVEKIMQQNIAIEAINKKHIRERKEKLKKFSSYKQRYKLRVKSQINNKIISAPAKAIPLLGTTAIITMTANDIKSICNEYDILNKFEKDVFETITETNSSEGIERLCKYDVLKELTPKIEKKYNESIRIMSNKIGRTEMWVRKEVINSIEDTYNEDISEYVMSIKGYSNELLDKDYNKSINQGKIFFKGLWEKMTDSEENETGIVP